MTLADRAATGRIRQRFSSLLRQLRGSGVLSSVGGVVVLMAGVAILAPLIVSDDPLALDPISRLLPPDSEHWFGTDGLGRDVFARTLYGGRVSLFVGGGVAALTTVLGFFLGALAGFIRTLDAVVMRVMDGMMAIPGILLAAALMAVTRPSVGTVIIAISIPEIPRMVRLVRSMVLSIRELTYVESATLSGVRMPRLLRRYILPNVTAPIIVQATFAFASAILLEAYLSLLGAGVPPQTPSWGNILTDSVDAVRTSFWPVLWPGLFISVTVLSVNVLGDCLRDYLDPRFVRRVGGAVSAR